MAKALAGPEANEEGVQVVREGLRQETALVPFDAFATGAGVDARGPYTALVLLHADEQAARENVGRLQKRIDEGTSWVGGQPFRAIIGDAAISREGRLVLAKLYSDAYRLWFVLQAAQDTFLLYE